MDKTSMINHFAGYLNEVFGIRPESVRPYYSCRVTINRKPASLSLMKYVMPDGYESIGITGAFDNCFTDVPMAELDKLRRRFHKQALINLFWGKHLVETELRANPGAAKVDKSRWRAVLQKLQARTNRQVPVNVTFLEYFKLGKKEWYLFTGDLLYNQDKKSFPTSLNDVEILPAGEPRTKRNLGKLFGEPHQLFVCWGKNDFGRGGRHTIFDRKYALISAVSRQNKLVKDNPWGF
ncbi:MAG: hypothetical protein Q8L48_31720 [Archangium sp.]|nr:hypothetical protein [Archangium sp.]